MAKGTATNAVPYFSAPVAQGFNLVGTTRKAGAPFLRALCEGAGITDACSCEATPPDFETKSSGTGDKVQRISTIGAMQTAGQHRKRETFNEPFCILETKSPSACVRCCWRCVIDSTSGG